MSGKALTVLEAARVLHRSRSDLNYLIQRGHLPASMRNGGWVLRLDDVLDYKHEEQRWVSNAVAAELTGLTVSQIRTGIASGGLVRRTHNHARASLCIASAHAYGVQREQRRRLDAAVAFGQQSGMGCHAYVDSWGPPPAVDGDVWLPPSTVALMLGCGTDRVRQLVQQQRLPAVRHNSRWWLRRTHVEVAAAARAFEAQAMRSA